MWDWLVYAASIAAAVAFLGALALLAVRALQALRSFKRLRRHVVRDLDRLSGQADAAAGKLRSVPETERLDHAIAQLLTSLSRLAVLRAAWAEATAFTSLVPRK